MTLALTFEQAVTQALQQRQATLRPCPMCSSRGWTLINGVVIPQTFAISGVVMSPSGGLPCVALVCNTCAFIAYYSLVALGLGHLLPR